MSFFQKIKATFLQKDFFSFLAIGFVNTFNGVWISYLLSIFFDPNLSFVIGYLISLTISYFLNSIFSFKEPFDFRKFIKYVVSYLPNFIIQNITVLVIYNMLGLPSIVAYLVAAVIGIPVTFLLLKFYAFSKGLRQSTDVTEKRGGWQTLLERPVYLYTAVLALFALFIFITNWSLLLGENLMKWDIWSAEYPAQVLMSDALAGGTIPMWNPLMKFGTPYYAIVGMPVWYPLTLLLAFIGYTPATISYAYALHLLIGAFGMFLLTQTHLTEKQATHSGATVTVSVAAGFIYCTSGVFLSNAEHIMIIISAAWIPYVFYFAKRYLQEKKFLFAMLAGACAGLILMGGYPEMFYNMFLFLVPYTLYCNYQKEKSLFKNAVASAGRYLLICILTILASAVTALPFLCNIGLISRGSGLGQDPVSFSLSTLLSLLFPRMTTFVPGVEASMVNYYMGVLVLITIPLVVAGRYPHKKLFAGMAFASLLLCGGSKSFLHSLFYRFLPMYDSFRFPTLSRIFLAMFTLLLVAPVWKGFLEAQVHDQFIKATKALALVCLALSVYTYLAGNFMGGDEDYATRCLAFSEAAFLAALVLAVYLVVFYLVQKKAFSRKVLPGVFLAAILLELFTYSFAEGPLTVTYYDYTAYSKNKEARQRIDEEFEKNRSRERSVDFAGKPRSSSGLRSIDIVNNKTFDEEGYISFVLAKTEDYKFTLNRNIISQNPVAYFTNDVVTEADVDYRQWSNSPIVRPEQVYADSPLKDQPEEKLRFETKVAWAQGLIMTVEEGQTVFRGDLSSKEGTERVRVYFAPATEGQESLWLQATFINGEVENTYDGLFPLQQSPQGNYVELFFPNGVTSCQELHVQGAGATPVEGELVRVERLREDAYVDVSSWGFNTVSMDVDAVTEGYLTVLQAKHSGWKAYVDGKEVEINEIDNCFMGIHLEKGQHHVELKFRPIDFFVGGALTIGYTFALVVVLAIYFIQKSKARRRTLY